jgi:hypothetical protein
MQKVIIFTKSFALQLFIIYLKISLDNKIYLLNFTKYYKVKLKILQVRIKKLSISYIKYWILIVKNNKFLNTFKLTHYYNWEIHTLKKAFMKKLWNIKKNLYKSTMSTTQINWNKNIKQNISWPALTRKWVILKKALVWCMMC